MACCVFTAYFMSQIIKACEVFDIRLLDIKYNDADVEDDADRLIQTYNATTIRDTRSISELDRSTVKPLQKSPQPFQTIRLVVTGMTCASCVATLTDALTSHSSVHRVKISLALSRATVVHNAQNTTCEDLISLVQDVGYGAIVLGDENQSSAALNLKAVEREEELQHLKASFNGCTRWATAVAILNWSGSMKANGTVPEKMVNSCLHAAVFGIACYIQVSHAAWIHRNAWSGCFNMKRARLPRSSMDTLLSLSLLLSLGLSLFNIFLSAKSGSIPRTYFSSASFLSVVISAGRYLDVTLKKQGASAFAGLFGLQKEMELGTVMVEGHHAGTSEDKDHVESFLTFMPTTLLAPLDVYHIPPQGLIPCDSYILRGTSLIAEANMTGESMPCRKSTGDFLMSGTRNLSNQLVAVVTKAQSDSSLEALLESIEKASELRYDAATTGSEERHSLMDSVVRHFVPAVLLLTCIGLALVMFTLPPSIPLIDRFNAACERAMAILAAACPCSLGLAAPSATMAGIDSCYASDILLPGGAETLEKLSRLTHMVLDKTGTLTEGRPEVSYSSFVEPYNSDPARRALCHMLLCAAERDEAQAHPVGRAVFQWSLRLLQQDFSDILDTPGNLKQERPQQETWRVFLGKECPVRFKDPRRRVPACRSSEVHMTTVHFAIHGQYAGTVILQDSIRRSAPNVLKELKDLGLSLTMLTGDSEFEAQRVASQLNIPLLKAKSLPNEKKDLVESLQYYCDHQHKRGLRHTENVVAMLGDGLNDAPAQAAADVGILFSLSPLSQRRSLTSTASLTLGTSAVDAIIISPELAALPKLLRIARKTARQARWNTMWAIGYNAIAITLAMGVGDLMGLGHIIRIDASLAGTMMAFSSVTVLGMSLHFRQRLRESH